MTCETALELISLYLDQELNREEEQALFCHLDQCTACKELFDTMQQLTKDLHSIPLLPLPDGFHNELMQKIEQEKILTLPTKKEKRPFSALHWKKYTTVAAALLIVVLVGSSIGNGLHSIQNNDTTSMPQYSAEAPMPMASDSGNAEMYAEEKGFFSEEYEESPIETAEENTLAGASSRMAMENAAVSEDTTATQKQAAPPLTVEERKKLTRLSISLEVEDFDQAAALIKQNCASFGGYTENYQSYIYYTDSTGENSLKQGSITLRVPMTHYEEARSFLASQGKVSDENESTEDITLQYYDLEGKLKMRQMEEERLLQMIEDTQNIEELIQIEERLVYVRSDLESYATSLKTWDSQVSYATITIQMVERDHQNLRSVDPDFVSKAKTSFYASVNQFTSFLQNIVLTLISAWLPLVLLAASALLVLLLHRKRRRKKKSQPPHEKN